MNIIFKDFLAEKFNLADIVIFAIAVPLGFVLLMGFFQWLLNF